MRIILDTETTGTTKTDQVIELAIIDADTAQPLFHEFFKPTVPIHPGAEQVHGITMEKLADAPQWSDAHSRIINGLKSADVILGYNVEFDMRLMEQTAKAHGLSWPGQLPTRDLMESYADIAKVEWNENFGTWKWQKLFAACEQQGIDLSDLKLHGAAADCIATHRLFKKLEHEFMPDTPARTIPPLSSSLLNFHENAIEAYTTAITNQTENSYGDMSAYFEGEVSGIEQILVMMGTNLKDLLNYKEAIKAQLEKDK